MLGRYNGSWLPTIAHYGKDPADSTWKEGDLWTKISGTWRQIVPPNAVILYDTTTHGGFLCDGSNSTPNLLEKYINIDPNKDPLTIAGSTSHANHGASAIVNTNPYTHLVGDSSISFLNGSTADTSHTHSVPSHSHPNTALNDTVKAYGLRPVMYNGVINTGAVIFSQNDLSSSTFFSLYSALDAYYIKMLTANGIYRASAISHNHGEYTGYTDTIEIPITWKAPNQHDWAYKHNHAIDHTDQDVVSAPSYLGLTPYTVGSQIYFDQLPSGSIVFFTSGHFPNGWTQLSSWFEDYLLMASTIPCFGGSLTHNHSYTAQTGPAWNRTNAGNDLDADSPDELWAPLTHTHTWTDSHLTYQNHMPLSFVLNFAVKD